MSFAVLGPVTFEVSSDKVRTWRDARRSTPARWHKHEVFKNKPKQEFLGPDLSTLTLSIRFDINRGVDPKGEIQKLRDKEAAGEVMQFTVGGELIGDFIVKNVDEDWKRHSRTGEQSIIDVGLSLEEYV